MTITSELKQYLSVTFKTFGLKIFNSLPSNKILDWSKFKAPAYNNKGDTKTEICFWVVRKYFGKRRKCWLPLLYPFPKMFSKALFLQGSIKPDCVID